MNNINTSVTDSDTSKQNSEFLNSDTQELNLNDINKEFTVLTSQIPCKVIKIEDELDASIELFELSSSGLHGRHFSKCVNCDDKELDINDQVLYSYDDCIDIARIVSRGSVARQKRKAQDSPIEDCTQFIRKTNEEDIKHYKANILDEQKARSIFLEQVIKHELNMKLVDIHYQFDRKKLFFFYISDGRVDFRELAKSLAAKFKTRIELRQIGVRDEAKKVGGVGTCGREFCCSTFLTNFKRITTQLASEQNLSSNLSKLSGPCGKLKCCLSYEVDEFDIEKIAEVRLDTIAETDK